MSYNLSQAISMIEKQYRKTVAMIEYEDGSGRSFNVRFMGENKTVHLRLAQAEQNTYIHTTIKN